MANKQVNAILSLTDKFSTPLFDVARNTGTATKEMKANVAGLNKMANRMERRMDKLVKNTFKWGKRFAIAAGTFSLKKGWDGLKELDDGARKVKSIAKETLELDEIKSGLLELSGRTGVSVEDLAESQYMAISSSVDPKESLQYAELAAKVGKAGFADPRDAINLIASMQNAFGTSGIENATKMADQFLHTQNKGIIEVGEMTQHYGKLIPLFSQAGVGYDEMNAGMATLTKMGMKPAEASTALAGAIRIMMKPTKQTKDALAELGLEFNATELKANGFGGMMEKVMKATGGDMDKITKIFPNARAMLAGASLTGKEGMGSFKEILKELQTGVDGSLEEAYGVVQGSLGNQWEVLKKNLKNTNTKFYMQYEGNLADKLKEINEWFAKNPEKIQEKLSSIADGIAWVMDQIKKLFDFVKRHQDLFKTLAVSLTAFYGALKLLRGLSKMKGTLELLGGLKLFGGAASLGKVGFVLMGIAVAAGGLYWLYKKIEKVKEKISKYNIQETPDGINMPVFGIDSEGEDPFAKLTEGEQKLKDISDSLSDITNSLRELWELAGKIGKLFSKNGEGGLVSTLMVLFPTFRRVVWAMRAIKDNIGDFLDGLGTTFGGFVKVFEGLFSLDVVTFFDGMGDVFVGVVDMMKAAWSGVVDFITAPFEAGWNLLENKFGDKVAGMRRVWDEFVQFFKTPITATLEFFGVGSGKGLPRGDSAGGAGQRTRDRKKQGKSRVDSGVSRRYKGDMSWKGGIVQVHERGGEILDLPGGTRIFPHDRSVRMAYEEGQKGSQGGTPPIVINFNGDLYGDDDHLVDRVGNGIANRLIAELSNM